VLQLLTLEAATWKRLLEIAFLCRPLKGAWIYLSKLIQRFRDGYHYFAPSALESSSIVQIQAPNNHVIEIRIHEIDAARFGHSQFRIYLNAYIHIER
jgi:hypothetical protein